MRTRGRDSLISSPAFTLHLVPGDLAAADRQLDPAGPRIGEVAGSFRSIDLIDICDDSTVAEIGQSRLVELDVEIVRRSDPDQLLTGLLDATHIALRRQPFDVGGEHRIDRVAVSRLRGRRKRFEELPCNRDILRAHVWIPHVEVVEAPGSSTRTPSPVRKAFGAQVIGSTAMLRRSTLGCESPVNSWR